MKGGGVDVQAVSEHLLLLRMGSDVSDARIPDWAVVPRSFTVSRCSPTTAQCNGLLWSLLNAMD
eukprot:4330971-Karenia_brevis.AAC.1